MTTSLTHKEPSGDPSIGEPRKTARPRRIVVLLLAGTIAAGAVAAANIDGTDSPLAPPAREQLQTIPSQEAFPGCLNDVECYGEPSRLTPGYWDRSE